MSTQLLAEPQPPPSVRPPFAQQPAEDDDHSAASLEDAQKRIGTTLRGKWRLERLIGIGGMGAVYEARHRNGMRGAVKVLDVALGRSRECRERFLREGRLANEVAHVGAVRVLDDDETSDGSAFLVMELLAGSTLDQLAMDRGGTLSPDELVQYAAQVLDTLVAAHARGIVHRDIKPENLFLTTDGVVKVLDFGIARMTGLGESARVTQAGEPIGTPAFMSPEQARGHSDAVDARSDLYSLGATMFTLATGEPIHPDATTVAELLVSVITQPARPVKQAGSDLPDALAAVIDKALTYDKRERFADALEMRTALEAAHVVIAGKPVPATPSPAVVTTDALAAVSTSSRLLRARFATTVKPQKRARWLMALAIPGAAAAVCAFVASSSASTRSEAAMPNNVNGNANVVMAVATPAPTFDHELPPPPVASDADPTPSTTLGTTATNARVRVAASQPTTSSASSSSQAQSAPSVSRADDALRSSVTAAAASSRLSRRSSLYDRRY